MAQFRGGGKLYLDKNLRIIFGVTLTAVMGVASITPAFSIIIEEMDIKGQWDIIQDAQYRYCLFSGYWRGACHAGVELSIFSAPACHSNRLYGMVLRLGQTLGPLIMGLTLTLWDIRGPFLLARFLAFSCSFSDL